MAAKNRYKVVRVYKSSNKRTIIAKGVTRAQAERMVQSYKSSNQSMVVFFKMD